MKEKIKKSGVWISCFLMDILLILCCCVFFMIVYVIDVEVGHGVGWFFLVLWFVFVRSFLYKGMFGFRFAKTLNQEK